MRKHRGDCPRSLTITARISAAKLVFPESSNRITKGDLRLSRLKMFIVISIALGNSWGSVNDGFVILQNVTNQGGRCSSQNTSSLLPGGSPYIFSAPTPVSTGPPRHLHKHSMRPRGQGRDLRSHWISEEGRRLLASCSEEVHQSLVEGGKRHPVISGQGQALLRVEVKSTLGLVQLNFGNTAPPYSSIAARMAAFSLGKR